MRQYFSNHPVINYRGLNIRNLMLNAQVVKSALAKNSVVYPYTLEEGDAPTIIAYDYYDSVDYVWLVLMSNGMIDPYSQWYKSQNDFEQYIVKKYGSVPAALSTVHHYAHTTDDSYPQVTPTTYQYMDAEEQALFQPVYAYDYELQLNESRRVINLIDNRQAARISLELERLLNQ